MTQHSQHGFLIIDTVTKNRMYHHIPRSKTSGAFGPISIATAPTPPVGRALPEAYTAMSPATTSANRPAKI